jgi:hypothetical protein
MLGRVVSTRSIDWLEASFCAGGSAWVTLRGSSMAPTLVDGDRLLVQPFSEMRRPRRGDVVVLRCSMGLVTHRVATVAGGFVVTRGDGCPCDDSPRLERAVLGRVVEVARGARRFAPPRRSLARHLVGGLRALARPALGWLRG